MQQLNNFRAKRGLHSTLTKTFVCLCAYECVFVCESVATITLGVINGSFPNLTGVHRTLFPRWSSRMSYIESRDLEKREAEVPMSTGEKFFARSLTRLTAYTFSLQLLRLAVLTRTGRAILECHRGGGGGGSFVSNVFYGFAVPKTRMRRPI